MWNRENQETELDKYELRKIPYQKQPKVEKKSNSVLQRELKCSNEHVKTWKPLWIKYSNIKNKNGPNTKKLAEFRQEMEKN